MRYSVWSLADGRLSLQTLRDYTIESMAYRITGRIANERNARVDKSILVADDPASSEIAHAFRNAEDEEFEDGMESQFARNLSSLVERHGDGAIEGIGVHLDIGVELPIGIRAGRITAEEDGGVDIAQFGLHTNSLPHLLNECLIALAYRVGGGLV